MSWGIAETAAEIEKIKSESTDYLNGLNSCGVIDWNTYNYAFDFYTDLLMKAYEQGRKDMQSEIVRCKDCKYGEQDDIGRWFCNDLGCQIGSEDGSGYCANAERKIND